MKGTITGFEFSNPHVQIFFDTKDDKGNVTHWSCESTNPAMLTRNGWSRSVLKPGDEVTMVVNPNKKPDGTVVNLIKVVLANGQSCTPELRKITLELEGVASRTFGLGMKKTEYSREISLPEVRHDALAFMPELKLIH